MRTRPLGHTGITVSDIGFGGWGLGDAAWPDSNKARAERALMAAVEGGVSIIDTAPDYGDGASETLIGQVVREMRARDQVTLATKVPPVEARFGGRPRPTLASDSGSAGDDIGTGDGSGDGGLLVATSSGLIVSAEVARRAAAPPKLAQVYPPAYVVRSVEDSLRRLRAEVLHVAQLSVWYDDWLDDGDWPEMAATMASLIKAGKVLHWGLCAAVRAPERALRAVAEPSFATLQVAYNVYERRSSEALFAAAREHNVGVIVRSPLDTGGLGGTLTEDDHFASGDIRARFLQGGRLAELVARGKTLVDMAADYAGEVNLSLPDLALGFCLHNDAVSTAIVGMRQPEHVYANVAVSDGPPLSAELIARLQEEDWQRDWVE